MMGRRTLFIIGAGLVLVAASVIALTQRSTAAPGAAAVLPDTTIRPLRNGSFNVRMLVDARGVRRFYRVFLPRAYDRGRKWPVILALHGSANRGSDNVLQVRGGIGQHVREQADSFPAIVVLPQVPAFTRGRMFEGTIMRMLEREIEELNGDPARIYVTGLSFGGYIAYDLAYLHPEKFAAVVPVAAGIDIVSPAGTSRASKDSAYALVAKRLKGIPIWAFQGELDENVPTAEVRAMVDALRANGANIRYTEVRGERHDVWHTAYRIPELYTWLFAQHR